MLFRSICRSDIDMEVPDADAFFPELDPREWCTTESRQGDDTRLTFSTLVRIESR